MANVLQVHAADDLLVALVDLPRGKVIEFEGKSYHLLDDVPAKHKFVVRDVPKDDLLKMYGSVVAQASQPIRAGQLLTTTNAVHATDELTGNLEGGLNARTWRAPDVSPWQDKTFDGYIRPDRRVGTRNHWLVVPLVFCENRNLRVMREAMMEELGYTNSGSYRQYTRKLIEIVGQGGTSNQIVSTSI
jgi:altronate hydrolase